MKNIILVLVLLLSATGFGLADDSIGLITELSGQATSSDKKLQLLDYLKSDQKVVLEADSKVVVSMVKGGARVTLEGPCLAKVTAEGAQVIEGKKAKVSAPKKRVAAAKIPSKQDLGTSAAIRRGALELCVGKAILPSTKELYFTALPGQNDFALTIFDSKSRIAGELYTQTSGIISLSEVLLQPGETYEFILDGDSPMGQYSKDKVEGVKVYTKEQEAAFRQLEKQILNEGTEVEKVELLAQYLSLSLNREALPLLQELLAKNPDSETLKEWQNRLKQVMGHG